MKTVGLAEPLRDALKPVASGIRAAFVYGSVARATDQASSDIDLMVVSDSLTYSDVFGALDGLARTLGRQVNPTVYSAAEFLKRAVAEQQGYRGSRNRPSVNLREASNIGYRHSQLTRAPVLHTLAAPPLCWIL